MKRDRTTIVKLMNALRGAEAASGKAWHSASKIKRLLPDVTNEDFQIAIDTATRSGMIWSAKHSSTIYAVRKQLNNLEQQSYNEVLVTCKKLRRPVQKAEVETCDPTRLSRNLSRLVHKGFLQKDGDFYAPTLQTPSACEVQDPTKRQAEVQNKQQPTPPQSSTTLTSGLQVSPQPAPFAARLRALAAALLALFVRP